jgi:hypothetical protein
VVGTAQDMKSKPYGVRNLQESRLNNKAEETGIERLLDDDSVQVISSLTCFTIFAWMFNLPRSDHQKNLVQLQHVRFCL